MDMLRAPFPKGDSSMQFLPGRGKGWAMLFAERVVAN